jgi:putative membrane protein
MAIYMTSDDSRRVTEAVATAELTTSGEIVTVLADRSDGYTDVAMAWAVLAAFTAQIVLAFFPTFYLGLYDSVAGGWNHEHSPALLFAIAAAFGITKFLGVMLLMQIPAVRFFMIPGIIRTQRVHSRAIDLFKVGAERRTHGRTGILIYLSMREHRAEIVADESITDKVAPEIWGDAMVDMLAEVKQGQIADGMIAAVRDVGKILSEHFPRAEDDQNELPDRLIEL